MEKYYCYKLDKILDKHEIEDLFASGKIDSNTFFYKTIKKYLPSPDIQDFVRDYVNEHLEFEFNQKDLEGLEKVFDSWWSLHAPYYYDTDQGLESILLIDRILEW